MNETHNSHALLILNYDSQNHYICRLADWMKGRIRTRKAVVEFPNNDRVFLLPLEEGFSALLELLVHQNRPKDLPDYVHPILIPCSPQVFGIMTEELKKKLVAQGLSSMGTDYQPKVA